MTIAHRTGRPGLLALAGLALLLAGARPAAAQEDAALAPASAIACTDCHDTAHVDSPVHADLTCGDCHTDVDPEADHGETASAESASPALCASCHDADLSTSVHPALACAACHGKAHAMLPVADHASPVSPRRQVQTCSECHAGESVHQYTETVHGWALLRSGLLSAPSCNDCHGSHDIRPASDPASKVSARNVPATCSACHAFILDEWQESAHGKAWTAGDVKGPVCVDCHGAHEIYHPREIAERLRMPSKCAECHSGRYHSYRDTFHGKVTGLGFVSAATCGDCHTPHHNLPASHPRSSVHPASLGKTCGECHGAVTASFASFKPHLDPSDRASAGPVYWVWLLMTSLFVGVFGFFGLHDALWLQRAVVAIGRGELPGARVTAGPYVRRFARLDVWMHVVVIVSFLLLAATGLPLRFHFAGWAQGMMKVMGGVEVSRFLHRLAAVVTLGYMAVHVAHLVYRKLIKRERGLFWGWRSMVPQRKDAADLWHNLLYFLYLRPRPRTDRWAYWEKFDYLAVFWGVVIIGSSGLMLWFPGAFTRWLPGWTLNAAAIIHGDEALLAVGFIFVFHFFHTHLRPESFPLDPVVFTGSMPLEKFKEERPLEYERLLASGQLESHLVDPPSPRLLRRIYVLGFTAVAIGVLLAVGILWGIVRY